MVEQYWNSTEDTWGLLHQIRKESQPYASTLRTPGPGGEAQKIHPTAKFQGFGREILQNRRRREPRQQFGFGYQSPRQGSTNLGFNFIAIAIIIIISFIIVINFISELKYFAEE